MILTALAVLAAVAGPPGAVSDHRPDPIATEMVRSGQKAVVRTVFQGSLIESFEAVIVGVMRGGRSEGDLILARATSERVIRSGIAQGMSGSPVYVDGKLIGALSSGWPFSREPVFGITPIAEMLRVLEHPVTAAPEGSAGPTGVELSGLGTGVRFREVRWDDGALEPADPNPIERTAASRGPTPTSLKGGLSPLPLPLACQGLHPGAMDWLRARLEPYGLAAAPGGQAASGGPEADALVPGAAVAIDVLRGDLQLSAIGTVTYRDGDRVLLFGHPFFQSGEVRMPMATAEITTVIASDLFSFKLGTRGRAAGSVTQDRRAAVAGRIGAEPRLMPFSVSIAPATGPRQSFRFESIEDRSLAPNLVALATLNSLLESGGIGSNQTLRWTMTLHRPAAAPLVITDIESGESPIQDLASGVASPIQFLLNNPYHRLRLDSLSLAVAIEPGRDQWTLRGARVLAGTVRPGSRVRVLCEIERWRGGRETREIAFAVPEELPDGRYTMWLGGAAELARYEAARLPGRYRPTSLDDAWRRLGDSRPSDRLYAALFARAPEVTFEGRDYPELPVSALALLASETSAGDRARRGDLAKLDEQRADLGGLVRGELQIGLSVDRKAP